MLRNAMLLLSGNGVGSLLSLARNLLIARLLPVEDYGIASTFAVALSVIEMLSALGLQTLLVQAKDGDDPRLQAALQGFQVLRGALSALLLFLAAGPIAEFMRLPELTWAYRVTALVPLVGAFEHFDVHRLNRGMRFGPLVMAETLPTVLTLAAVWPLVAWLGDWRVMLCIIVMQTALRTILTHLLAERHYRMRLDPATMRRSLGFGWPLLVNGILLFGVFQGDRVLVARELGPTVLGIFSIGVTLTLAPTLVMARSVRLLFLPLLSNAEDPARFERLSRAVMQAAALNAGVMMVGVFLVGPPFVALVLGADYLPLLPYLAPLALVQALRVLKTGGNVIALSRGQTANTMISNVFRVAMLPVIWLALVRGYGLEAVIALGALGEVLGTAASLVLVRRRLGQRLRPLLPVLGVTMLLMGATALPLRAMLAGAGIDLPAGTLAVLVLALLGAQVAVASEFRDWLLRRLRRRGAD